MLIKNNKISGDSVFDALMGMFIILMIATGTLSYYSTARDMMIKQPFDRLGLIYHLSLSNKEDLFKNETFVGNFNDNTLFLNNTDITPIQQAVIKTLKCESDYCRLSTYQPPESSFLIINYNDNNTVDDLKFYFNLPNSFIFSFPKQYPIRIDDKFNDRLQILETEPDFKYVLSIHKHLTYEYYLDSDLVHPVSKEVCLLDANRHHCLYVLHYNKNKVFDNLESTLL